MTKPMASFEEILARPSLLWEQAKASPATSLLRLALLRDLFHVLHARKSESMAKAEPSRSAQFQDLESRIVELRDHVDLEKSDALLKTVRRTHTPLNKSHPLPEALSKVFDPKKLEREDRKWERALASEGFRTGWTLWSLEAWAKPSGLETLNQRLSDQLWPNGVILFVESAGFLSPFWKAHWFLLLPGTAPPPLDPSVWGTFPEPSPGSPQWHRVFTPIGKPQ